MAKKKKEDIFSVISQAAKSTQRVSKRAISQGKGKKTVSQSTGNMQSGQKNQQYNDGQYGQFIKNSRLQRNKSTVEREQKKLAQNKKIKQHLNQQKVYQKENKKNAVSTYGELNSRTQKNSIKNKNEIGKLAKGTAKRYTGSQILGAKDNTEEVFNNLTKALPGGKSIRAGKEVFEDIYDNTIGKANKKLSLKSINESVDNVLNKTGKRLKDSGQQDIEDIKRGKSSAAQFGIDIATGMGELGADALLTGGKGTMAAMYNRAYGAAKQSALDEGATEEQAKSYAKASGGLEAATEKMFAVATPLRKLYGKGAGDELTEKVLNKLVKKAQSQTGKNIAYNTGKTMMSAITEGLEEMVSEGLEPSIANAIYAESLGKPHSTSAKDVLYAGAVGGAMGGILGGAGQVVDSNRGKRISDNAENIFGEGGVMELVKKGLEADENSGTQRKSAAYKTMIEEGNGIANAQVAELAREVGVQYERDRSRFDIMTKSADSLIKKNGYAPIINISIDDTGRPITVLSENTQKIFDERRVTNENVINDILGKELQLPQEQTKMIASSVSAIQTGVAGIDDISFFNVQNPEARTAYTAITGVELPKTNQETKQYLLEFTAKNKVDSAQAETEWFKDSVKGLVQQDMTSEYAVSGQKVLGNMAEHMNVVNVAELNSFVTTFDDYYNAGRGGLSFSDVTSVNNPLHDVMSYEDRVSAFEAGARDREMEHDTASGLQVKLGEAMKEIGSKQKGTPHRGKLISELSNETRKSLKSSQQSFFRSMARIFNIDIHIVDNENMNGMYDNGVMYLSVNADRDITYVFAHEITHHMQDYAPEEYLKFKNFIRDRWTKQGGINEAIRAKKAQYAEHEKKISQDEALDEIVADATYEMLQDENFVDEVCRSDRNMAQAILNAIKDILNKIRKVLVDGDSFTPKQNEALLSNLDILKEAEKLWVDGLAKAVENRKVVNTVDSNIRQQTKQKVKPFSITRGEIFQNMKAVAEMSSVITLDGSGFTKQEGRPLSQAVMDYYGGKEFYVNNSVIGDVKVGKRGIKSGAQHKPLYEAKIDGFKALKEVIQNGLIINVAQDYKNDGTDRVILAAPIKIKDKMYYMGTVINRMKSNDMQNYYIHDVILAEKNNIPQDTDTDNRHGRVGNVVSPYTILQQLNNINTLSEKDVISDEGRFSLPDTDSDGNILTEAQRKYFKNSKVTDEGGKLLPVYHGTSEDFSVFDRNKIGENYYQSGNSAYGGFYFTDKRETADNYAKLATGLEDEGRVVKAYLDIINPFEVNTERDAFEYFDDHSMEILQEADIRGNDGIIVKGIKRNLYVAFESNQIKNIDNKNPTDNPDIRYSLKNKNITPDTRIPYVNHSSYMEVGKNDNKTLRKLQDKVKDLKRGTYENKATGYKADINGRTIGKILNPSHNMKHVQWSRKYIENLNASIYLPELFYNAVYVDTKEPQKSKNEGRQIKGYHHFIAPIYMNGKEYRVRIVAREKENSDLLYIVDTELLKIKDGVRKLPGQKPRNLGATPSDISIPELINGVKIYDYDMQKNDVYTQNDIRFSLKDDTDITYDSLVAKPDIKVAHITTNSEDIESLDRKGIANKAKDTLKNSVGLDGKGRTVVHNKDIDSDIIVGKPGIEHGLDRNFADTAIVSMHLAEYLKNAVKINEAAPDGHRTHDSDILLGYGESDTGNKMPAYFVVSKLMTGEEHLVEFGSLYSLRGKKIEDDSAQGSPGVQSRTSSTISISDLLDIVNEMYSDILPESVAEHYGNEKRKTKLGESVRFSLPDEDSVYNYMNENETEFFEITPVRDYERRAGTKKRKSIKELEAQIDKLKADKRLTYGKILDESSIMVQMNELVKSLMIHSESYNALGNERKVNSKLVGIATKNASKIYKAIKDGDYAEASNVAYETAREIVEGIDIVDDTMFNEYKRLRDYLRNTQIKVSAEVRNDIPDFTAFRKSQMGRIRMTNDKGIPVDSVYAELTEIYPEFFGSDIEHPADQLMRIAYVRDSLEPYDVMMSEETTMQLIKSTAQDILNITVTGKPWKSFADKYDDRLKALKAIHKEAMRDLKIEERTRATRMVEREKSKAKEKTEKQKTNKEHIKKYGNIYKNYKWLSDRLVKPTDDKHIPEGFRKALADLLQHFNFQTERSKALEVKYGKAQKTLKMENLRRRYAEIAKEDDSGVFEYDGYIFEMMDALAEKLEGKSIDQAMNTELAEIDTLLKAITHNIRNYDKAFSDELTNNISKIAIKAIESANKRISHLRKGKHYDRTGILGGIDSILNESMIAPRDFFEILGGGMNEAFISLRKGFDGHVDNITEARKFFAKIFKPYTRKGKPGSKIEKWRDDSMMQEFSVQGGTIKLNPAQIMSLYCLAKREQAMGHILGSGIVASKVSIGVRIKRAVGAKVEADGTGVIIGAEDIDSIVNSLTAEQKVMADRLQEFLNNECARWGNETSMRIYGYKKFTEENYFPIKSADAYIDTDAERRQPVERIKNFGFTKGTITNANNPIMVDDIFKVVSDHINKMSLYNAFAAPISDFMRVYNYRGRNSEGKIDSSVKSSLQEAYGRKVINYINNFISDLNNQVQIRTEGLSGIVTKSLANYKKATIGGNLRVAFQQPTAIVRAFTVMNPIYFVGNINVKKNLKEMKEHCQVARWKSWGFSQVDMARDIDDIMMNSEWSRIDAVTMEIYGALDNVTWSFIWGAVKKEIKSKHPNVQINSEEFYELCNERAAEVFEKTQVVDSVFNRSQVMRNNDTMSKMLTSFMAEPTRTYNMLRTEFVKAGELWKEGQKTKAFAKVQRTAMVFVMNAVAVSAAAAVADALRGKAPDDDDDDSWYANFLANFIDNINPLNMVPVAKDLMGVAEGWSIRNMALQGWESLIQATTAFINEPSGENAKAMAEGLGLVTGIPVKNILREREWVFKVLGIDVFAAEESSESEIYINTEKSIIDKILDKFGYRKTEQERYKDEVEKKAKEALKAGEGLSGKKQQEAIWKVAMENYTTYIEDGDFDTIIQMRDVYKAAGGDMDIFDERVLGKTKSAVKNNIGEKGDSSIRRKAKSMLRDYYGWSDERISREILSKTDTAKELKKAMAFDDWDAAKKQLTYLKDAGLTFDDFVNLYDKRFSGIDSDEYTTGEFIVPTTGRISSEFGYRNPVTGNDSGNHKGIDIAAATGTNVAAADGGKVAYVGYDSARGYYVDIKHVNGIVTRYQHLDSYGVQKGQVVQKGQKIAEVGSTGDVTGPHLHLEVRYGYKSAIKNPGEPINPRDYFNF